MIEVVMLREAGRAEIAYAAERSESYSAIEESSLFPLFPSEEMI
jgi:hypothetical protein